MMPQQYWNDIGSEKVFENPIYLDKFSPFLSPAAQIIEYGCGYGRVLSTLKSAGYCNLVGFDFAPNMVKRGLSEHPSLDLRLLDKAGEIPCDNESIDAIVLSTVLCCIADEKELTALWKEVNRVLKKNGIVYLTDFLITNTPKFQEKYTIGLQQFGTWGIYTTTENVTVRHFTAQAIMNLLHSFDIQWFEQFDFKTMNQNPIRTFHCIAKK